MTPLQRGEPCTCYNMVLYFLASCSFSFVSLFLSDLCSFFFSFSYFFLWALCSSSFPASVVWSHRESSNRPGYPHKEALKECDGRCSLYRVHRCTSHTHPGEVFQATIARQPKGSQYRTIRLRKALGEMLPSPNILTPPPLTLFQLWRCRAWKIDPGGGGVYTVVYGPMLMEPVY